VNRQQTILDRQEAQPAMADFEFPADLRYTVEHEWVRPAGTTARVGITAYAQEALGDVVYVSVPGTGSAVSAGQACGEVESTKSVSDIFAPVSGTVTAVNEALDDTPELVNTDPYGEGWIFEVDLADPAQLDALLDSGRYREQLG
jgi:glycine cleavage system H protein